MESINNNEDASEAQGVLKRTLKEQDVCQKLQKQASVDTQTKERVGPPLLAAIHKRGVNRL